MISKLMTALAVLVIGLAPFAGSALADEVTINTLPLTRQIYMLTGQGGNLGLLVGSDGTFLIDDQYAPLTDKILAAIKAVGGEAIGRMPLRSMPATGSGWISDLCDSLLRHKRPKYQNAPKIIRGVLHSCISLRVPVVGTFIGSLNFCDPSNVNF